MGWVTGRNRSIQHKSGRGVDFLGTCLGGNGLGRREKPIDSAQVRAPIRVAFECTLDHGRRTQRVTGFMQELTSDGKSGKYPKSRLFGYLLWWCWVGSKLLGNDILNGDAGSALRGSCKR